MSGSTMTATARSTHSAGRTMRLGAARAIWSIAASTGAASIGATRCGLQAAARTDRKSTRLNSSHQIISYAVFCLKKKKISDVQVKSYSHAQYYKSPKVQS